MTTPPSPPPDLSEPAAEPASPGGVEQVSCRRCGDPILGGESFCSSCGFAFGMADGVAHPARRRADGGPGPWIVLPALVGLAAVVTLVVVRLATTDPAEPAPATTATTSSATTSAATTAPPTSSAAGAAVAFVEVSDESGRIVVNVPESWTDVSGSGWTRGDTVLGPALSAAVDRDAWATGWDTPGLFLGVDEVRGLSPGEMLDAADFSGECVSVSRGPYDDGVYVGEIERYASCGDAGSQFVQIAARPDDRSFLGFLQIVLVGDGAEAVLDEIIASWQVQTTG